MSYVDVHCHVSRPLSVEEIGNIGSFYDQNGVAKVVVMSGNHIDGEIVYQVAQQLPNKVVPSLGIHPWYCHLFYTGKEPNDKKTHYSSVFKKDVDDEFLEQLPQPMDFNQYFETMLDKFQEAFGLEKIVIGEIGLDKLAKIPTSGYYGRDAFEGRPRTEDIKLSTYRTSIEHQRLIFSVQVHKALELNIPMSIHCVKAMSHIIEIFQNSPVNSKKSHLMLHSYTGSSDSLKLLLKYVDVERVYISVSAILNQTRLDEFRSVISSKNILMESDVSISSSEYQLGLLKDVFVDVSSPLENLESYLYRD